MARAEPEFRSASLVSRAGAAPMAELLAGAASEPRDTSRDARAAADAVVIPPFPWLDAMERFEAVLRSRIPAAILEAFVELVRELSGARGATVHLEVRGRGPLATMCGIESDLAAELGLGRAAVPLVDRPRWRITDVAESAELSGTFLSGRLEGAGVQALDSIEVGTAEAEAMGLVTLFLPMRGLADETTHRLLRNATDRMLVVLEHICLASSAEVSAQRLQTLLRGAHDAVFALDRMGIIESANPAANRMFGYRDSELVGRRITMLFHPADQDRVRWDLLEHGDADTLHGASRVRSSVHEVEARCKDGSSITIDVVLNPLDGGSGFTAVLRDLSARKAAEARVRETDRLAVIGTLAAGLGHDMNNVMLPIRAHLNAIAAAAKRQGSGDRDMHIAEIRESLGYLQHLADALHSLALDPEGAGDGVQSTEIKDWWMHAGPLLSKALYRAADLAVEIPEGLPPVAVPPHALTRAVLNLLVNAGEAMPKERSRAQAKVLLRVTQSEAGRTVLIEVIDNGVGMPEAVSRRAFDMFYTTKTRGLGTGLGLPLVRRVAERAGGSVQLSSRPGHGATVAIRLSWAVGSSAPAPILAAVRLADGRTASLIGAILEAGAAHLDGDLGDDEIDILVIDADRITLACARHWVTVHPARRLVVLGELAANDLDALHALGVSCIPDIHDLAVIERGLETALAPLQKETRDE